MPLRVFTLVPDLETGIFDDTELHEFSKNHQILSKKQDLYFYREQPMMVIFLEYRNKTKGTRYFQGKKKAGKPKVELTEGETNLYESLRRWRNDTAKSAGISPMNILHNLHLEEIVRKMPKSLTHLKQISGIGEVKAQKYGAEILALIHKTPAAEAMRSAISSEKTEDT